MGANEAGSLCFLLSGFVWCNRRMGDNLITAWGSEPQNPLIPANTTETGGGRIVDSIYSGLVYYDSEGKAQNELAE